ncbi:MAG: hypothetical protein WC269_05790, partial [Candidatus Gracilibacteria bacterium]|jgi:hypothetical protein
MQDQISSRLEGITSLPDRGLKSVIHAMDYPFLVYDAFSPSISRDDEAKCLRELLLPIIRDYMEGWLESAKAAGKNPKDAYRHFFQFPQEFDFSKAYKAIIDGKTSCDIHVSLNNSNFQIKRFGNCLGIRVMSLNGQGEIHVKGTTVMEQIANRPDSSIGFFWHRAEFVVPLPKRHAEGSIAVDTEIVYRRLVRSCPLANWISMPEYFSAIADGYVSQEPITIGEQYGIDIQMQLVHSRDHDSRKEKQWRRGNIVANNVSAIYFADGNDLCLSITIHSGLPKMCFLHAVDPGLDVCEGQFKLKDVASVIYLQLSAQSFHDYRVGVISY